MVSIGVSILTYVSLTETLCFGEDLNTWSCLPDDVAGKDDVAVKRWKKGN